MFALIMGLLAQAAVAAADAPSPNIVTSPDWLHKPTGDDIARVYPGRALHANQEGRATIQCKIDAAGALADCHVLLESPQAFGFGEAALKLVPRFAMRPMAKNGAPVAGGTISIPIRFLLPGDGAVLDPLTADLSCYGQAAVLADREPGSVEAWTAVTFYSAQVAAQTASAKSSPKMFEESLQEVHRWAASAKSSSAFEPSIRKCLDFAMKNMKPVVLPTQP